MRHPPASSKPALHEIISTYIDFRLHQIELLATVNSKNVVTNNPTGMLLMQLNHLSTVLKTMKEKGSQPFFISDRQQLQSSSVRKPIYFHIRFQTHWSFSQPQQCYLAFFCHFWTSAPLFHCGISLTGWSRGRQGTTVNILFAPVQFYCALQCLCAENSLAFHF